MSITYKIKNHNEFAYTDIIPKKIFINNREVDIKSCNIQIFNINNKIPYKLNILYIIYYVENNTNLKEASILLEYKISKTKSNNKKYKKINSIYKQIYIKLQKIKYLEYWLVFIYFIIICVFMFCVHIFKHNN